VSRWLRKLCVVDADMNHTKWISAPIAANPSAIVAQTDFQINMPMETTFVLAREIVTPELCLLNVEKLKELTIEFPTKRKKALK
jgi:hypothetical protein